ncbi:MAG: glycosyl transferase family 2 [Ignavibacteriales bacterium]
MPNSSINKIVTVVQARVGSSRLPYKVMLSLAGKPLLLRMLERVRAAKLTGTIVVATTEHPIDDIVVETARREGYEIFRGDENDVLSRHYHAARLFEADTVVKIPSDCPLIDPHIINRVIQFYIDHIGDYDYVSNLHPATFPDGNDVEIFSLSALQRAYKEAVQDFEREHTTPYIWEHPNLFKVGNVCWETGEDFSMTHRFTIDYEEDYLFIRSVYDHLYQRNPMFGLYDILQLLSHEPELLNLNIKFNGVNWYRHHLHQLKTVTPLQTKVI